MDSTEKVLIRNADRVDYLLYLKGFSQADLAEKSGITPANISHLLNKKKTDIKLSTLVHIAEALGVDVAYLFQKEN